MAYRFTPTYPSETISLWRSLTRGDIDESKKLGSRTVVIAEAGTAHMGSVDAAKVLVDKAVNAGCDVVKFQAFDNPSKESMFCWIEGDEERVERWQKSRLGSNQWWEVKKYCARKGIHLMLSCFEARTISWAEEMRLPCMKVASRAAENFPWDSWDGPSLVSTGMWRPSIHDISALPKKAVLMECTAQYPAEIPWDCTMPGYSSHSSEPFLAIQAVAAGAAFVECHFHIDEYPAGPDEPVSLWPFELVTVCEARDYYYNFFEGD